jgi:hypothetical protein
MWITGAREIIRETMWLNEHLQTDNVAERVFANLVEAGYLIADDIDGGVHGGSVKNPFQIVVNINDSE